MIPNHETLWGGGGLRVISTQKFKSASFSLQTALPLERKEAWKNTLLLAVLRRGCEQYPTLEALNSRLDYLWGAELSVRNFFRGDSQIIGLGAEFVDAAYLPAGEDPVGSLLEVMMQLLFHPLLDERGQLLERYVESEKSLHIDTIRSLSNNPRAYASAHCREAVYAAEPSGQSPMGRIEDVEQITAKELTEHWRRLTAHMTPDFFYVGGEDPKEIRAKIQRALQRELRCGEGEPVALTVAPPVFKKNTLYLQEELPVSQGQLLLALRTDVTLTHALYPALLVYNEILGASPISKLFVHVRERMSLCYHCSSSLNSYKGTVMILCGLEPSNRQRAEDAILAQISAMAQGDFTEEELTAAVLSLQNGYRQLSDSPGAMENYYYCRSLLGVNISPEALCRCLEQVTKDMVREVAATMRLDTVYFLNGTLKGGQWDEED